MKKREPTQRELIANLRAKNQRLSDALRRSGARNRETARELAQAKLAQLGLMKRITELTDRVQHLEKGQSCETA